jgi:hypothetical protein
MVGGDELSLEITPSEAEVGFELSEGTVVVTLGHGICAVKIRSKSTGAIRYAICDDEMNLLYPPAGSLEELERRFPTLADDRQETA